MDKEENISYILSVHRHIISSQTLSLTYWGKSKCPSHKIFSVSIVHLRFSFLFRHAFNITFYLYFTGYKFCRTIPHICSGMIPPLYNFQLSFEGLFHRVLFYLPSIKTSRFISKRGFCNWASLNLIRLTWIEHQNLKYENKSLNTYEESQSPYT